MPAMVEALQAHGRTIDDLVVAPRVDVAAVPDIAAAQAWADAGADELILMVGSPDIADHRAGLAAVAKLHHELSGT